MSLRRLKYLVLAAAVSAIAQVVGLRAEPCVGGNVCEGHASPEYTLAICENLELGSGTLAENECHATCEDHSMSARDWWCEAFGTELWCECGLDDR